MDCRPWLPCTCSILAGWTSNAKILSFALQAGELWKELTQQEGYFNICQFKEPYKADINIPVRYNEPTSILNIRRVLSYLTKEEQKEGLCSYGCNEVPQRPMSGRPRKAMDTISEN